MKNKTITTIIVFFSFLAVLLIATHPNSNFAFSNTDVVFIDSTINKEIEKTLNKGSNETGYCLNITQQNSTYVISNLKDITYSSTKTNVTYNQKSIGCAAVLHTHPAGTQKVCKPSPADYESTKVLQSMTNESILFGIRCENEYIWYVSYPDGFVTPLFSNTVLYNREG